MTHLYRSPGQYRVVLLVTDSRGASNATSRLVTVQAGDFPNAQPVVDLTWELSGFLLRVSPVGSYDPDGEIIAIQWDFGNGGVGQGIQESRIYEGVGAYSVEAVLYDNEGGIDASLQQVVVEQPSLFDRPLVPRASIVIVDFEVQFDASASFDDHGVAAFEWQFGDEIAGPDIQEGRTEGGLSLYFALAERIDAAASCECLFEIWIDRDGNSRTGFATEEMGAEFSVLMVALEDGTTRAILRWYVEDPSLRLPRWRQLDEIPMAFGGTRGEGVLWESDLLSHDLSSVRMFMSVTDLDGRFDSARVR